MNNSMKNTTVPTEKTAIVITRPIVNGFAAVPKPWKPVMSKAADRCMRIITNR